MAKGKMPEVLFVAPVGGGHSKKKHRLAVFEILDKDCNGRPTRCELLYDDQVLDLEKTQPGMSLREFMTAYVPEVMLKR